jgi:hypothetical protein
MANEDNKDEVEDCFYSAYTGYPCGYPVSYMVGRNMGKNTVYLCSWYFIA